MKEILSYYTAYNVWANQKMADFFREKEEEKLSAFIENSFPSIKKTAIHILSAERSWLARLNQDTQNNKSLNDEFDSTRMVFDQMIEVSKSFNYFVERQSEHFLENMLCYNTWDGTPWEMQPKIMIHHCMNHSTYHRGQLLTMARQLGWKKELPSTDLLYYWREEEEKRKSSMV